MKSFSNHFGHSEHSRQIQQAFLRGRNFNRKVQEMTCCTCQRAICASVVSVGDAPTLLACQRKCHGGVLQRRNMEKLNSGNTYLDLSNSCNRWTQVHGNQQSFVIEQRKCLLLYFSLAFVCFSLNRKICFSLKNYLGILNKKT